MQSATSLPTDTGSKPPINAREELFAAILASDVAKVKAWYARRLVNCRALDDASLDLANRCKNTEIITIITTEIAKDRANEERRRRITSAQAKQYDIVVKTFDRRHYFREIRLETFRTRILTLEISYHSELQAQFLVKILENLLQNTAHRSLRREFNLSFQTPDQIRHIMNAIFQQLKLLKRKDKTELANDCFLSIIQGVENFFRDAQNNFPDPNYFLRADLASIPRKHDTYEDYKLYEAALHARHAEVLTILRNGGDANATFDNESMIYIAASRGANYAFNNNEITKWNVNAANVIKTVKYLLQYGADPGCENYSDTVTEDLIHYYQYAKNSQERQLYLDLIVILAAARTANPGVTIHPQMQPSPLVNTVMFANAIIQKKLAKKPYVTSIETNEFFSFDMKLADDTTIKIVTKKAAELGDDYLALLNLFSQKVKFQDVALSEKKYFDNMLNANGNGIPFVDLIYHQNELKGFVIGELIQKDGKTIYHAKYSKSLLGRYSDLMMTLTFIHGFANHWQGKQHANFTYYEVASARGFAILDCLDRHPIFTILMDEVSEAINTVHANEKNIQIKKINDCYYVKDDLDLLSAEPPPPTEPTMAAFAQEMYRSVYEQRGHVMSVYFKNDAHNFSKFLHVIANSIGVNNYFKMLTHYVEQNRRLLTRQNVNTQQKIARF